MKKKFYIQPIVEQMSLQTSTIIMGSTLPISDPMSGGGD